MLFSPLLIIAGASIVSSTPVSRQENSCLPNAMGVGVSFINWHFDRIPYLELGIGSAPQAGVPLIGTSFRSQNITLGWYTADWHLRQNGQDPPSYIIRDIDNNNLAVTSLDGVNLVLEQASDSGNKITQLWDISCNFCYPNPLESPGMVVAEHCTIKPHGVDDHCVEISSVTDPARINLCNGSTSQLFRIQTGMA